MPRSIYFQLVFGLKIPVLGPVLQAKHPKEIRFSTDEECIVDREICAMLHQGVIEPVNFAPEKANLSPIYLYDLKKTVGCESY